MCTSTGITGIVNSLGVAGGGEGSVLLPHRPFRSQLGVGYSWTQPGGGPSK